MFFVTFTHKLRQIEQKTKLSTLIHTIMFDFITIPLTIGIICAGIYGLFELFVRKKERLTIIEKIGDKLDASAFEGKMSLPNYGIKRYSFNSLRIGLFLTGVGLGLVVGYLLYFSSLYEIATNNNNISLRHEIGGLIYSACVLLFGGLGLFLSFLIELYISRKDKTKENLR